MWWWKKKLQHFTKGASELCRKKKRGDGGMFIITLVILLFFCLLLKATFDYKRIHITYDSVDDSIVSALTSACTFNTNSYGHSGQVVIYDAPIRVEEEEIPLPGATAEPELTEDEEEELAMQTALDNLNDVALFMPVGDYYLNKSYDDFMAALKRNLKLDANMESSLSGIEGVVILNEFSIYNRFEEFDEDGNLLAYRIIRYTTSDGVAWSAYGYSINTPVDIYNSYDKANSYVDNTTVTARLTFDIRKSDYNPEYMKGLTEADMTQTVSYQRLVDIKKN